MSRVRTWGPWTEVKLDALSDYLGAFARATQRARGTLYLDLFAGAPDNASRDNGRSIMGSPERALRATPPLSKLIFCELQERSARQLEARLTAEYPGRDVRVLPGDCNATIPRLLRRLDGGWRHAPSFAFIDQYAAEVDWATMESLARFKDPKRSKVELWLFFGDGLIPRGAWGSGSEPELPRFADRVDRMFGTPLWREVRRGRNDGLLDSSEYRAELINLMRWRLEHDLSYHTSLPLSVTNEHGTPIYTMIFATDHGAGEAIMKSVFRTAERALAEMRARFEVKRRAERDTLAGVSALFGEDPAVIAECASQSPTFEAPRPPWRHPATDSSGR